MGEPSFQVPLYLYTKLTKKTQTNKHQQKKTEAFKCTGKLSEPLKKGDATKNYIY